MPTDTLQTRPRVRYACEEITSLAQEMGSNAQLPTMVQLRESLGVSMNTLHAALRELESQQVVRSVHGVGIYVQDKKKRALTGNIGFIGSAGYHSRGNPFHTHLMEGVQRAVNFQQQHLLYLGSDYSWNVNACEKIDGLLLCNIENPSQILRSLPSSLPCVSLLTILDDVTSVGVDDYEGARMAVRYLMELGHQRIACLMEKNPSESRRRYTGYCDALSEAGVEAKSDWTRLTDNITPSKTKKKPTQPYHEWARMNMKRWMSEDWEEIGCTAILVQNEVAAVGVMQVLQEAGISVPQDVSVMGFDGTELCDLVSPRLSTVEIPLAQIGAKGIEILNNRISGERKAVEVITLPLNVREGESVTAVSSPSKVLLECG